MTYDDDAYDIRRLIIEHVSSPSLRHIRTGTPFSDCHGALSM